MDTDGDEDIIWCEKSGPQTTTLATESTSQAATTTVPQHTVFDNEQQAPQSVLKEDQQPTHHSTFKDEYKLHQPIEHSVFEEDHERRQQDGHQLPQHPLFEDEHNLQQLQQQQQLFESLIDIVSKQNHDSQSGLGSVPSTTLFPGLGDGSILTHEELESLIGSRALAVPDGSSSSAPDSIATSSQHAEFLQLNAPVQQRTTYTSGGQTGETEFLCPYCAYTSNRKDNLKTHIRRHTGEKPYVCPICEKRFTCKTGLNMHVRTHSNDRENSLSCTLCSYQTKTKVTLKYHMLKHHSSQFKSTC